MQKPSSTERTSKHLPLRGVTKLRAKVNIHGRDSCWNQPKYVGIRAGEVITKPADSYSTRYGHLFFTTEDGRWVEFGGSGIVTTYPGCTGYYDPDIFEEVTDARS